jgi:hypothetical protein
VTGILHKAACNKTANAFSSRSKVVTGRDPTPCQDWLASRLHAFAPNRGGDRSFVADVISVEAYEWHHKEEGRFADDNRTAAYAVVKPAAVFSHNPSQFRTPEQRMGEPRSFLHEATDDEGDSVHYSERW